MNNESQKATLFSPLLDFNERDVAAKGELKIFQKTRKKFNKKNKNFFSKKKNFRVNNTR